MGFSDCPGCWPLGRTNWAPVLGRCQGLERFTELTFSLGLASGPTRLFFKPYQHLKKILPKFYNFIFKNNNINVDIIKNKVLSSLTFRFTLQQ